MSSTDALQARVAALAAGTQPTPPASDPIVTNSLLPAKLVAVIASLPTTLPSQPGVLWNNGGVIQIS
jgi:hypothetical protein